MWCELGNQNSLTASEEASGEPAVTYVNFPPGVRLLDAVRDITNANGLWPQHSDQPPAWVESDNPSLKALLIEAFTEYDDEGTATHTPADGRPEDVEGTHHTTFGPPGVGPEGPIEGTERGDALLAAAAELPEDHPDHPARRHRANTPKETAE